MARLEDLQPEARIEGISPGGPVTVLQATWHGSEAVEITYRDGAGDLGNQILYQPDMADMTVAEDEPSLSFDADGEAFRMVSEAHRIGLAYLFDPLLAVHTSVVEPLPHQIVAVYGDMLSRQPLKFLLADDPGAGKTIMAGLLVKELIARGDVVRCLVCAPGGLVEQWQDEMQQKFGLAFRIMTRGDIEASVTGNPFAEESLVIGRLDQMARNEDVLARLADTEWDLVICDEAHKMSAHYYGKEIDKTKRYQLGEVLRDSARHFLLMTATPHNGKNEDFELFLALLDPDRFENRSKREADIPDASDLWRRSVKEELVRFDGTPLFPERRAYTIPFTLSAEERTLYEQVSEYVRKEMNRADRLRDEGQGRRGNNVGFALTVLQRRLASSPEAIYSSLKRRRERLEAEMAQLKLRGGQDLVVDIEVDVVVPEGGDGYDDFYDENLEDEATDIEDQVLDRATAARTVKELEIEISSLRSLEEKARQIRNSNQDAKWTQLSKVMQDFPEMHDADGVRRKIIIFTEHRDTLRYLEQMVGSMVGNRDAVVVIHGSLNREARRAAQNSFIQEKDKHVLIATDAAGEGINLQCAHLMINYDLPWNPNRIEQRFGRIHRIGQKEVCHLWNLMASGTREALVYERLLEKLERAAETFGGKVFDVLGATLEGESLRDLLIQAIRYGDRPEVRAKLSERMDNAFDEDNLRRLLSERALAGDTMDAAKVQEVREDMERAEARKLQPHHISSFFIAAFSKLGGRIAQRETNRYEVTRVPAPVRNWKPVGRRAVPILRKYQRICFDKELINVQGKPTADLICPGHPLLDAVIALTLRQNRDLLDQGAVFVDRSGESDHPRALVYLQHEITDGRKTPSGAQHVVSRELVFVEIDREGNAADAGWAPYLNYDPATPEERGRLADLLQEDWLAGGIEDVARSHAIAQVVPQHMARIRERIERQVAKTLAAVEKRLTREITHWDRRAEELKGLELSGKNPRLNSGQARGRAEDLQERMAKRRAELAQEGSLANKPPVIVGIAVVVPAAMVKEAEASTLTVIDSAARKRIERIAINTVMAAERALGREPKDVGVPGNPWDIESRDPDSGELLFIEVKGRAAGQDTVTVTRHEIYVGLNKGKDFILALVLVDGEQVDGPYYLRDPFEQEPAFAVTSVTFHLKKLMAEATGPC